MFENSRQRVVAAGSGALAGLLLLGGVAMAQTPEAPSTPEPTQAAPQENQPAPGEERQSPGDKDCPRDGDQGTPGTATFERSSYSGPRV